MQRTRSLCSSGSQAEQTLTALKALPVTAVGTAGSSPPHFEKRCKTRTRPRIQKATTTESRKLLCAPSNKSQPCHRRLETKLQTEPSSSGTKWRMNQSTGLLWLPLHSSAINSTDLYFHQMSFSSRNLSLVSTAFFGRCSESLFLVAGSAIPPEARHCSHLTLLPGFWGLGLCAPFPLMTVFCFCHSQRF